MKKEFLFLYTELRVRLCVCMPHGRVIRPYAIRNLYALNRQNGPLSVWVWVLGDLVSDRKYAFCGCAIVQIAH